MKENHNLVVGLKHAASMELPNYRELDLFRDHIEEKNMAPHQQPYQAHQKQTLCYQLLFCAFGLLFAFFLGLAYSKNLHWGHMLFFQDSQVLKSMVYLVCAAFSATAFWAAYKIRPEMEAVQNLHKRANCIIRAIYHERLSKMGVSSYLPVGNNQKQVALIKNSFKDTWTKTHHAVEVTVQLLLLISATKMANGEIRITLYNQAILELQDKLHAILQVYQQNPSVV